MATTTSSKPVDVARTPSPWKIDDCDFGNIVAGTRFIARLGDEFDLDDQAEADAAFVVRACNAHDDLLAAAEEALEFVEGQVDVVDGDYGQPAPNKAMILFGALRDAIAKAAA